MEKFLKIGEQYVQWIALGLGAVYLGLMAWLYVAQPPITVTMEKKDYLPGEVDQQIKNVSLRPILEESGSKTVWADPKPWNEVDELKVAFVDHAPKGPALALAPKENSTTRPVAGPPTPTIVIPPAPVVSSDAPSTGLSQVGIPQAVPAPAANAVAGAAAAAPAALVQPVIDMEDRDWDTIHWTVVAKELNDAFQAANIPDVLSQTAFLRIEVVRQEVVPNGVLPNGKPPPEYLIPDITTVTLLPMPTEKAPPNPDKLDYRDWAASNTGSILTPPFFGVSSGTPWYPPGTPKPNDVFAQVVPQPGAVPAVAPPPPLAPRFPIGVGPNGVHGIAHGPAGPAPAIAPGVIPRRGPANPPAIGPGTMPPPGGLRQFQPAGAQAGFINPAVAPDITIYTHDWTIEPGHSYHYKMRYTISNPLFNVQTGDVKPADRDRLAITSPYSDWTAPIDVPSHFRFWVQKFRNGTNEVTFDLFTKKPSAPGGLERSTIRATPGDSIGPSPWLLVDVRQDSNRHSVYYFLIADPTGHIERHEQEKDKNDPDHLEMLDRTGASAAAIGAA